MGYHEQPSFKKPQKSGIFNSLTRHTHRMNMDVLCAQVIWTACGETAAGVGAMG
jgi:hypothetical protein